MGETKKLRVLFLDDDPGVLAAFRRRAARRNLEMVGVARLAPALELLAREHYDAVVADVGVPDGSGLELVRVARSQRHPIPTFVFTGKTADEVIYDVVRAKPSGFFFKPRDGDALMNALLELELRDSAEDLVAATGIIGASAAADSLRKLVARYAGRQDPVLVTGESGTGKELVALALHRLSGRRGACETINVAAVAPTMFEAELFGSVRGAFTGAVEDRAGPFERTRAGTLFLDEIGELGAEQQAKLLRVLEAKRVRRVGGHVEIDVSSARLVYATNRDLHQRAAAGHYRPDLVHRLDGLRIEVPPLADRREDIPELAASFARERGLRLTPDALAWLSAQTFPGNVRELKSVVARIDVEGEVADEAAVARGMTGRPSATHRAHRSQTREWQTSVAKIALDRSNGNLTQAGHTLGVSRFTVKRWAT